MMQGELHCAVFHHSESDEKLSLSLSLFMQGHSTMQHKPAGLDAVIM